MAPAEEEAADGPAGGKAANAANAVSASSLLTSMRRSVIGHGTAFDGPFGRKTMLYADWTASGRALAPVEDYVRAEVLPMYANTHTTTSVSGLQSTCFRQEARQVIAQACNARVGYSDKHSDVVVFAGSGSTGAINKLALVLGVHLPLPPGAPSTAQPVVILGPHEHHSNILPWRESAAKVVHIPEGADGGIDRAALRDELRAHASHSLVIGSFSAASNVTGIVADVDGITEELHRAGALAFWDYATAATHLAVDVNPVRFFPDGSLNPHVYKDAVFISPHKLPGGPGAPGVLVAKRSLFVNDVPAEPGGGTVFFVTGSDQRYISNRHEREEGGTQDIAGSIRAGLAFQVKTSVGSSIIAAAEASLVRRIYESLMQNTNIAVLGPPPLDSFASNSSGSPDRLPIISFLIRGPADANGRSRFLHNSFVCATLNDVFGVQVRGGCACAGPYALRLLGIDTAASAALETLLLDQAEVMRPGFVRLSLPYFASNAEVEYALAAVHAIADHGWRMLPLYRLDAKKGEWRHKARARSFPERKWLAHMRFPAAAGGSGKTFEEARVEAPPEDVLEAALSAQLAAGLELLEQCGQQHAGSSQQKQLRVPALSELELSGEHEMLTSGVHDDDDDARGRLAYDIPSAENGDGNGSTAVQHNSPKGLAIDSSTADSIRWFMFPSEGAALLRAELRHVVPRAAPRSGPHLPLAVRPPPGRLAGAIRPLGYDDTKGVADSAAPAWPTGIERLTGSARNGFVGQDNESLPRTESHKHPLRENVNGGGIKGGFAHQRALSASGGFDAVTKLKDGARATAMDSRQVKVSAEQMAPAPSPVEQPPPHPLMGVAADVTTEDATIAAAAEEDEAEEVMIHKTSAKSAKCSAPPPKLLGLVAKAVSEWQMIQPGDRVLLGLSGGKDSLAMLHILKALQRRYPPGTFELACCTIDPGTEAFNPRPLIAYVESLGVKYFYNEEHIMGLFEVFFWLSHTDMAAEHMSGDSICAFCARMKRGALYSCMRKHGYNKLVLAQHLDDLVESFFMSVMHNGLIRTMKAASLNLIAALRVRRSRGFLVRGELYCAVDEGDLTVIRPGIYCRERQLRDFAYAAGLPVINENCPACFEAPKERHHIKKLLAREEGMFPSLYPSLRKALIPLLDPAAMDLLAAVQRTVEEASEGTRRAMRQRAHFVKNNTSTNKNGAETRSGFDDGEEKKSQRDCRRDCATLGEATEAELLAELVRRRQAVRSRGRFSSDNNVNQPASSGLSSNLVLSDSGMKPLPPCAATADRGVVDTELNMELVELQTFCTADGCERPSLVGDH